MDYIEKLSEKRRKWIEANQENEFEEGIKNLLTELYPDNAHFIYELLQNAEDAQATRVKFVLQFEGLFFQHNGKKQFSETDIKSITGIGNSPKKGDVRKIGEFGVGFKAVFSYTSSPRVYSGRWAFEINDLVCPKKIDQIPEISQSRSKATYFQFPFNHLQKNNFTAFNEIRNTIKNLPENTILFLQNIQEILWEIEGDNTQKGYIKREELQKPNCYEIKKKTDNILKTYWLKFTKTINQKENLAVSIAFRLNPKKTSKSERIDYQIDSKIQIGDVAIYFPAEKETSNLKFYIHAPFAATVARDSIKTQPENEELRDLLVELFIESIPEVKKIGMLDDNFLAILPNDKDKLPDFYKPFQEKIIDYFQTQNLTPTWNNDYLPAKDLIQSSPEIKKIINKDSILSYLAETKNVDWAIDAEKGSRKYDFLESLQIKHWTWKDLLEKVSYLFSNHETANEILSNLSDDWMQNFYVLLEKAKENTRYWWHSPRIEDAFIVRLKDGGHVIGEGTYFQTQLITNSKKIPIVKSEVYQSNGNDEAFNEKSKNFLRDLGVKDFSEKEEIKLILERFYADESGITEEENIKHLKRFITFLRKNPSGKSILQNYPILKVVKKGDKKKYYSKPSQVFCDKPFEKTNLAVIEQFLNKSSIKKLWSGYSKKIKNQKEFIRFLKDIGVNFSLKIKPTNIGNNPNKMFLKQDLTNGAREMGSTSINVDYKIEYLSEMLQQKNRDISQLIWETLSSAEKIVLQARYRPNQQFNVRTADSQLVDILKRHNWIPDKDDDFNEPQEITREMLPDDFPFNNRNGWLTALGFGTQTEKSKLNEQQKLERLARQLNLTVSQLEKAKEWAKMSDEEKFEFEEFRQKKKNEKQLKELFNTNLSKSEPPKTETKENEETEKPATTGGLENLEETEKNDTETEKDIVIDIPVYEIEYLVKSRSYQRKFKEILKTTESKCRLTGIEDIRFLVASHIKPVRDCTDREKIDANNGLLLSPHVDELFDRGWISFTDDGKILIKNEVEEIMKVWGLDFNQEIGSFNDKQMEYLAYHRKLFNFD